MRSSGCSSRIASVQPWPDELRVGCAALRLHQGIVIPGCRGIDVDLGRSHVVVAGQDDRHVFAQQLARMRLQAPEPRQLVVEFGPRLRIAVGQVDAADEDAADGGLDVARLIVLRIAG